MRRTIKQVLSTILVSSIVFTAIPMLAVASSITNNNSKDINNDGRISQGYIIAGESHIGAYTLNVKGQLVIPAAQDVTGQSAPIPLETPAGGDASTQPAREIEWRGNTITTPITDGHSGLWTVIGSLASNNKGWLANGGEGYNGIVNIIGNGAYANIEHWNVLVCYGTNYCVLSGDDTYCSQLAGDINSLQARLSSQLEKNNIDVHYLTVPTMQAPWDESQRNSVKTMTNAFLGYSGSNAELKVRTADLATRGSHSWSKWCEYVANKHTPFVQNDFLPVPKASGSQTDKSGYDGCHLTALAYQDVFHSYIQDLEKELGSYKYAKEEVKVKKNEPLLFEELKNQGDSDNGLLQSFVLGLNNAGVELGTIGYPSLIPIADGKTLLWNIWYKYYTEVFRDYNRRMSTSTFKIIEDRYAKNKVSYFEDANDLLYKAFAELPNAKPLTMTSAKGKFNSSYCAMKAAELIKSNFSEYNKDKEKSFIIIEVSGAGAIPTSGRNTTEYMLVVGIDGDYAIYLNPVNGATGTYQLSRNGQNVSKTTDGQDINISGCWKFTYTGEVGEVAELPLPQKKPVNLDGLIVHKLTIDVTNYSGPPVRVAYASDVHICKDNVPSKQDRIPTFGLNGDEMLEKMCTYAGSEGIPIVLGADICDYASKSNYAAVSSVLSNCTTPVYYIRADHDVAIDHGEIDIHSENSAIAEWSHIPGAINSNCYTTNIGSLKVAFLSDSTRRNSSSSFGIDPSVNVVFTHVPFDFAGLKDWTVAHKDRYYCWTNTATDPNNGGNTSTFYMGNNSGIANTWNNIQAAQATVISGHVHANEASPMVISGGGVNEVVALPGFLGNMLDITFQ